MRIQKSQENPIAYTFSFPGDKDSQSCRSHSCLPNTPIIINNYY